MKRIQVVCDRAVALTITIALLIMTVSIIEDILLHQTIWKYVWLNVRDFTYVLGFVSGIIYMKVRDME